jgi:hypothetical protein
MLYLVVSSWYARVAEVFFTAEHPAQRTTDMHPASRKLNLSFNNTFNPFCGEKNLSLT